MNELPDIDVKREGTKNITLKEIVKQMHHHTNYDQRKRIGLREISNVNDFKCLTLTNNQGSEVYIADFLMEFLDELEYFKD